LSYGDFIAGCDEAVLNQGFLKMYTGKYDENEKDHLCPITLDFAP
jgi:hypothetical protein